MHMNVLVKLEIDFVFSDPRLVVCLARSDVVIAPRSPTFFGGGHNG